MGQLDCYKSMNAEHYSIGDPGPTPYGYLPISKRGQPDRHRLFAMI